MLHNLQSPKTKSKGKRKGRGMGSGKGGHTVGRGQKGQLSRSGYKPPRPLFAGGANTLAKRFPKLKGFSRKSVEDKINVVVNLDDLNEFKDGDEVTIEKLFEKNIISGKSKNLNVKILANGKIDTKVTIKDIKTSKSAKEKIEKAGGTIK
jgi:large subunit ribosomal protein L15